MSEEKLTLKLNHFEAKSLQIAIATLKKNHPWKELDEIEGLLEDFTGTATIIWRVNT